MENKADGKRGRSTVTGVDRAKQFLPFDAMKGLTEALLAEEERHSRISRRRLTEEEQGKLSHTLSLLQKGDPVRICFFKEGHYWEREGRVTALLPAGRRLRLEELFIPFEDILRIRRL